MLMIQKTYAEQSFVRHVLPFTRPCPPPDKSHAEGEYDRKGRKKVISRNACTHKARDKLCLHFRPGFSLLDQIQSLRAAPVSRVRC